MAEEPANAAPGQNPVDAVISAAHLATAAFRMRDQHGLVAALRELTNAVAAFDKAQKE